MSLLQGGFEAGFMMHDIVRQYAISRCPGLCQAQRGVVYALLNAGRTWPRVDRAEAGSADYYVAVHGSWHIKGALSGTVEDDMALAARLVEDLQGLAEALAIAVGTERMQTFAASAEEDWLAVRFLVAGSLPAAHGHISAPAEKDLLRQATTALRKSDGDSTANRTEIDILERRLMLEMSDLPEFLQVLGRFQELVERLLAAGVDNWQVAEKEEAMLTWVGGKK